MSRHQLQKLSHNERRGRRRIRRYNRRERRLRMEPLEERRLLAITVNTLFDELDGSIADGDISLRDAIASAPAGETINFHASLTSGGPATIELKLGQLNVTKDLTIVGPGAELLTIDASGNDPTRDLNNGDGSRVFSIDDGTSAVRIVSISGLTLTGADSFGDGGAIFSNESLSLNGVWIQSNAAQRGGGIANLSGHLTVTNSFIGSNDAGSEGGGISNHLGDLTVTNSTISGNSSLGNGGGISNVGQLALTDSSVSNNESRYGAGGGIAERYYGGTTLTRSQITGNTAMVDGGGIATTGYGRFLSIFESSIEFNTSRNGWGGGIRTFGGANLAVNQSTIAHNTASQSGGGIASTYAELSIANSVISGNQSTTGNGGGIYASGGGRHVAISDSLVTYNSAVGSQGKGGGIHIRFGYLTLSKSVISGNSSRAGGGGIYQFAGATNIASSAIRYNVTQSDGGGLQQVSGFLEITGSTISGNSALDDGGGIDARDSYLNMLNSTVSSNSSGGSGGGMYLFGQLEADFRVRHSTIAHNIASSFGGGVTAVGGSLALSHTIVAANSAPFGFDIVRLFGTTHAEYSLIGHNEGSGLSASPPGMTDGNGNRIGPVPTTNPLRVYIELAAMGDFEGGITGDRFVFEYSIDGGPFQPLFTSTVDEDSAQTYFMDNGALVTREDPLLVNGLLLSNFFQGITAEIPVSGDEIQIRFSATNDGPTEAFAWRNLFITDVFSGAFVGAAVTFEELGEVFASYSADPDYNVVGDMFGIRSRLAPGTGGLPIDVADDSISISPGDMQGIIGEFDAGRFFGAVDTVNGVGNNTNRATWTFNNLMTPLDPLISPLSENGGMVLPDGSRLQSHALQPDSPAMDMGDPNAEAGIDGVPESDARGYDPFVRVFDGDGDGESRIDIGAVEHQSLLLVVDTLADEDDGNFSAGDFSLREALGLSNSNLAPDVIEFDGALAGGTIVLSLGELAITDAVRLIGLGDELLTIDASGNDPTPGEANGDGSRVFYVTVGEDVQAEVSGLTITGGDTFSGAGLFTDGEVLITDCAVIGNAAYFRGGGIENLGRLTITGSTIAGNSARYLGGGILAQNSLTVTGSVISGNTAGSTGGGIYALYADVNVVESVISGNQALDRDGGGIYARQGTLSITGSWLRENFAEGSGGGIRGSFVDQLSLSGSTLSSNFAGDNGGGIAIRSIYGTTNILNSTISGNFAELSGGGLYCLEYGPASLTLRHSTIASNSAQLGGGVFIASGGLDAANSIVADNAAGVGADITGVFGFTLNLRYTIVGTSANNGLVEAPVGSPDIKGNMIGGPINGNIDPRLLILSENDGPLLPDGSRLPTHGLNTGSPALDSGDPAAIAGIDGVPEFDQRRAPFGRVSDGDADGFARLDMGALEALSLTFVVDTLADEIDGDYSAGDLSLREAIALSEASPGVDRITFDPALAGGTLLLVHGSLFIFDAMRIIGLGDTLLRIDASGSDFTPNSDLGDGISAIRVLNSNAIVELRGLTITGGDTFAGGAIHNSGTLSVVESTISGNAASIGGGIYSSYGSRLSLVRSTVSGNAGRFSGGGISTRYGNLTVTDSTISNNLANYFGGGVYSTGNQSIVSISGSTISTNTAGNFGGGIFRFGFEPMRIRHSTVTGNRANFGGGGIYSFTYGGTSIQLDHSIVAGNMAGIPRLNNDVVANVTLAYSFLGVNTGATIIDNGGNLIGTSNAPINPLLGPLTDNGGPTKTHALLAGSPAIDAGEQSAVAGVGDVPLYDQRGAPMGRIFDGDNNGGARIDMGATEHQPPPNFLAGDYNHNGVVDAADFVAWRRQMGGTGLTAYAEADGDGNGKIEHGDFGVWRSNFGSAPSEATAASQFEMVQAVANVDRTLESQPTSAAATSRRFEASAVATSADSVQSHGPQTTLTANAAALSAGRMDAFRVRGARLAPNTQSVSPPFKLRDDALVAWAATRPRLAEARERFDGYDEMIHQPAETEIRAPGTSLAVDAAIERTDWEW